MARERADVKTRPPLATRVQVFTSFEAMGVAWERTRALHASFPELLLWSCFVFHASVPFERTVRGNCSRPEYVRLNRSSCIVRVQAHGCLSR